MAWFFSVNADEDSAPKLAAMADSTAKVIAAPQNP